MWLQFILTTVVHVINYQALLSNKSSSTRLVMHS